MTMTEPEAAAEKPAAAPATLDDLMLAMDVVDTLRHRERLVERELNEEVREEQLIDRLRTLYKSQGIDVPDSVIAEGVKALKENRFVYTPPEAELSTQPCNALGQARDLWQMARGRARRAPPHSWLLSFRCRAPT